jgi:hypothetical protein
MACLPESGGLPAAAGRVWLLAECQPSAPQVPAQRAVDDSSIAMKWPSQTPVMPIDAAANTSHRIRAAPE